MKNKTSDKQKLLKAIELLEALYDRVHTGCSFDNNELTLHKCLRSQQKIFDFVKPIKPNTHLTRPVIKPYNTSAA